MTAVSHLRVNDQQFYQAIDKLGAFVSIPSVSNPTSSDYNMKHLMAAAQFAGEELRDLDLTVKMVSINGCAPFVVAKKVVDAALPTITLYAHYDAQPVERDKWKSDPFVMKEENGRLFARAASDDKCGAIAIMTALRVYKEAQKKLPVNINVLFEGEEEYGSKHMSDLLKQEAANLKAQAMVVLDGSNKSVDAGTLTSSTRGLMNLKLRVDCLEKPVHSGLACAVPCPATRLVQLAASITADPRAIEGFMDEHQPMGDAERAALRKGSIDVATYSKQQGLKEGIQLRGDSTLSVFERVVDEPNISIVNINAGQRGGGNSIQESAECTISARILRGQDPKRVADAITKHILAQPNPLNLPTEVTYQLGAFAWQADLTSPYTTAYLTALEKNFSEAVVMPLGGTLPLLREFEETFPEMNVIVPGVEDPDTSAHSHNESQHIGLFRKSIDSLIAFLDIAATIQQTTL